MDAVLETFHQCARRETCLARFALEGAAEGALWMDASGALLFANRAVCALLGFTERELLQTPLSLLSPQLQLRLDGEEAESAHFEAVFYTRDRSALALDVTLTRVCGPGSLLLLGRVA